MLEAAEVDSIALPINIVDWQQPDTDHLVSGPEMDSA
jgi:hypothetical protein